MEREIIERLSMDSAAGELNEDIEALLQDYLSKHKEAKEWFLETCEIFKKTQAAFDAKTDLIKRQAVNKIQRKFTWLPVLRWAAVIIISACIGATAGRWSRQEATPQKQDIIVTDTPSVKKTGFNLDNIGNDFWRNKITAMVNHSPAKIQIIEEGSGSSLLETYIKYIKERNHE